MNEQDVEKKLVALVAEILPPDPQRGPLGRSTKLLQDPGIDSLTMASLGFAVSGAFGIGTEELVVMLPNFGTLGEAATLIHAELQKAG